MDDGLQRHGFDESTYERPNRWWKCGHAEEGCPCHVGPDALGRCQASYECSPVRRGDRWTCARPKRRGGSCEEGPRPDGTCACRIEPCQPELTVRAKRGVTTVATAALTLGVVLALFGGPWFDEARLTAIFPGDLSREHAAIDECAACHVEGNGPGRRVAAAGTGAGKGAVGDSAAAADSAASPHAGLGQSGRCMTCHESSSDRPLRPHGLVEDTLDRITRELRKDTTVGDPPLPLRLAALGPEPPGSSGDSVRCATCHREHRGRESRLASMGQLRCQSCHTVQFASFARGHPDFGLAGSPEKLPYRFDHAAHEAEHFPDEGVEFTCTGCHGGAAGGAEMGERDFATMCSDCHSQEIREGALIVAQVPGVDYRVLDQQGVSVGTWPVDAGINVVTPLSPVMRTMLSADTAARRDMRLLKQVDLTYIKGRGQDTLRAAGDLAWGVKRLFRDLATGGRAAMADRLARGLGVELREAEASALTSQRGPDEIRPEQPGWLPAIRAARRAWLPDLEEELARRAAGETPGLRVYEEYGQPTAPSENWLIDSFDFTIRYLPRGHADVFLRELVEVSARAAATDSQAADLFAYLTSEDGPGSCGKCHRASRSGAGGGDEVWTGGGADTSDLGRLTRFDHEPHKVVACRDCHRVGPEGGIESTRRRTCASCHDGDRASARCLNCHSYHTEGFSTRSEASLLHPSTVRGKPSDSAGAAGDTAASTEPGGTQDE